MSDTNAMLLAEMLMARKKRLLARAVLTHQFGTDGQLHWQRLNS
jgi:hypothetical protein